MEDFTEFCQKKWHSVRHSWYFLHANLTRPDDTITLTNDSAIELKKMLILYLHSWKVVFCIFCIKSIKYRKIANSYLSF